VKVRIPTPLRSYTDQQKVVEATGGSVGAVLDDLDRQFPGLRFRVVDEERVSFLHDRELPWLLPGVAATGRRAEVLAISVATVRQGRLLAVRTLWDHTTLLAGLGLPPDAVHPAAVSLSGGEGPRGWW